MASALEGKRVLLVDDDNDILTSMQAAFEPTGAVIESATNGNKAVEIAEKNNPDIVVLDMMLPGRSGFLVLEKIKARKPRNAPPHRRSAVAISLSILTGLVKYSLTPRVSAYIL